MYSSEDLERFYFQYQTEALPRGESIQSFCLKNNVSYNIFEKWYRDTRSKIVEVKVDSMPSASGNVSSPSSRSLPGSPKDSVVKIRVEFRMSNGLRLSRKNLSYRELVRMVEKLEVLC